MVGATRRILLFVVLTKLIVAVCGCASLHRNVVAQNVIQSRQLSLRGIDALHQEDWQRAEDLFAQAIKVCPTDEIAHQRYAEVLWRKGYYDVALRHMETATELSGGGPALRVKLGEMYLSRGLIAAAGQEAEHAVRMQPNSPGAWALLGDIRRQQGLPDDAIRYYHRAVDLRPHYPEVQFSLGELYLQLQRPRRALATLNTLVEAYPPEAAPQHLSALRGIALKRLGRYEAAVAALSEATQGENPPSELLYELAEAQWLAGKIASAKVAVQAALAQTPNSPQALHLHEQIQLAFNRLGRRAEP